jgi:hypothetical protein
MAQLSNNVLTLADWAKRLDPKGTVADIVELLGQTNEILQDMLFVEGNLPTGTRTTMRTGLPSVAWRLINNGVQPSKSTTAQVDEHAGMLEAWSEVDKDLLELNGNSNAFRLSEGQAFLEAMNQEMAQTLFYGNSGVAPEEFTGLSVRYSNSSAPNGQNIVKGGGSGSDNTSIWLVVWGQNSCHGIFPKGSKAGIYHEDEGLVTVENANGIGGARMKAYRDHWQWKCGIALRDWRYVVRIPNIDVSNLTGESSAADLVKLMTKALYRVPSLRMGRPVFYCNRTVAQFLDLQMMAKVAASGVIHNVQYNTKAEAYGGPQGITAGIPPFRGVPIRICDQILENEPTVS